MGKGDNRKHRATGKKPPGGKREGSGRPEGSANTLEYGEVRAIKAAGLRVPEGAHPEARDLADEALGVIIKAMRGEISFVESGIRQKAAVRIREEVCGPLAQKHEHAGHDGGPLQVSINVVRTVAEPVTVIRESIVVEDEGGE